jgi:hypothetical protein
LTTSKENSVRFAFEVKGKFFCIHVCISPDDELNSNLGQTHKETFDLPVAFLTFVATKEGKNMQRYTNI